MNTESIFFFLFYFSRVCLLILYVRVSVYVWVMAHVWTSEDNFMESFLFFHMSQLLNSGRQA